MLMIIGLDIGVMGRKLQKGETGRDCAFWTLSNGGEGVGKWYGIKKSHFDDLPSNLAPLVFLEIVKSGENAPGKYNTHLMRDVPLAVRDTISIKQHSGQNILPGGQSKRVRTWHMACGN